MKRVVAAFAVVLEVVVADWRDEPELGGEVEGEVEVEEAREEEREGLAPAGRRP